MKKLIPITFLFLVSSLAAQEAEQPSLEIDPEIDPIAAEVFGDDVVAPGAPLPDADVPELPPQPVHEAPTGEQTVPVAEEPEVTEEESVEDFSTPELMTVQLPPDATVEEELIFQYDRYLKLMHDGVFDEADSVAKRVVELAIQVKGPKSKDFAKALTNLAIVQHRTSQYDAAQQNFESSIEIIEDIEDRLNGELINPLKGLGAAQLANGRPDLASATFSRAVHVSHVNDGPHNLNQVAILESLTETNMRLGSTEDARVNQDMIYALNERAFAANSLGMVPSLVRRAEWQRRAGFINDQRVTLRRTIRIIELNASTTDLRLIEPLMLLGNSFFYVDISSAGSPHPTVMVSGEVYFKRALRIASENPAADWQIIAETSLALGDYYMYQHNEQRASRVYKVSWLALSDGNDQLAYRAEQLEQVVTLRQNPIQRYISVPTQDATGQDVPLLQGNITIAYEVSRRGEATNLKIVESQPAGFSDMVRLVQREMRSRVYRPRFVEAEAVTTDGQVLIHRFYYRQSDLDAVQENTAAAETDAT
jgi:tetratricopeptide (TPR) repeat protein